MEGKGSGKTAVPVFETVNRLNQEWKIEGYLENIVHQ